MTTITATSITVQELDLLQAHLETLPAASQLREALTLIVETLRSGQDIHYFSRPSTVDSGGHTQTSPSKN
jgi:hypothetical protein